MTTGAEPPIDDDPSVDGSWGPSELPDIALVARASELGDESAFTMLLDRHADRLHAVALRIVGSPEDAEDVVQEASLRIWRGLAGFRGDARFSTWSHRIVTNVALDHLRRPPAATATDRPARVDHLDPARHSIGREAVGQLWEAVASLPPAQRTCFLLSEVAGMAHDEIARELAITVSAVKNRLYRARTVLAAVIEDPDSGHT
ncbi:RNA polymerase sigma factor [Nitriliruptor alkaliphilus]|uniref:RNA polymerase sigma factor n=1 Tax=Nitriliruptor alkaliphilus TaxID=427918 RepID=UPI000695EF38|nr:RNA polymerase sigma factor [Nitriliruptor alkaliphilus]